MKTKLTIITGGAGSGKSTLMSEKIRLAAESGRSVIACIPEQFSFEYDRMMYERLGIKLYNSIEAAGFSRIAADIFAKFGGSGGRSADDLTRTIIIHCTISRLKNEGALSCYSRQAGSPAFAESCLETIKELMTAGITPESLISFSSNSQTDAKLADISLIYAEYVKTLAASGYKDSHADIYNAALIAREKLCFMDTDIFIDEFKSFTGDQYQMIAAMLSSARSVTVALSAEKQPKKKYGLFDTPNETVSSLTALAEEVGAEVVRNHIDGTVRFSSDDLRFLSENILRPVRKKYSADCQNVKIAEGEDIYSEADYVCAEIRRLTAEEGYRFSDIAVVSRNMSSYRAVLEGAFERYGIVGSQSGKQAAGNRPEAVFTATALKLAAASMPSAEDILRLLKTELTGFSGEEISEFENYIYTLSIDGKLLSQEFVYKTDMTELNAEELAEFLPEKIRKAVMEPIERFANAAKDKTADEICMLFCQYLEEVRLTENTAALINQLTDSADSVPDAEKLTAAREHKQLLESLSRYISAIRRAAGGEKFTLADFYTLFSAGLSKLKLSEPPQTLDCVTVEPAETARLADPKVIFILGVNDGIFPMPAKASGLFTARERTELEQKGLKLSGDTEAKSAEERFIAYNMISAASEKLFLTYTLADASGAAQYPSSIIGQTCGILGISPIKISELPQQFFATTPKAAFYSYAKNIERKDKETASLKAYLKSDPATAPLVDSLDRAGRKKPHKIDDSSFTAEFFGDSIHMSASSFEAFSGCPFAYFCKYCLGILARQQLNLQPSVSGSAIHHCLFKLLSAHPKDFPSISAEAMDSEIKAALAEYRDSRLCGSYGKTMRFNSNYSRIFDTVKSLAVHLRAELAQSSFLPKRFEFRVRFRQPVGNNSSVFFSGIADRIDIWEKDSQSKYLRVVDYKSGKKTFRLTDVYNGVNMQMLFYLFMLTDDERGAFSDAEPAGVLYQPAGVVPPSLGRSADDKDVTDADDKFYKMKGFVLEDYNVLSAMEQPVPAPTAKNAERTAIKGKYIPVAESAASCDDERAYDKRYSRLVSAEDMRELRKHAEKLLTEAAERLYGGDVDSLPLLDADGKSLPCSYCDYKSVCGNFPPSRMKKYSLGEE